MEYFQITSILVMRDNWHIQTQVLDDSPLSFPFVADEQPEPYSHEGEEGSNGELLSVSTVRESLEHSRQNLESRFIEKQPTLIRSLMFDEPMRKKNCIKDMEYSQFLSASIKEHQPFFPKPLKAPHLSVDQRPQFSF